MPSVFTIEGTTRRKRTSKKKTASGKTYRIGECKTFKNRGRTMKSCYVGKSKTSPTGWRFQKASR
jgi:hypothetical protein